MTHCNAGPPAFTTRGNAARANVFHRSGQPACAPQTTQVPAAPTVYRPQAQATQRRQSVVSQARPSAPPVYRPRPGTAQLKQAAPPVYRPQPRAAQLKPAAPPVCRPQIPVPSVMPSAPAIYRPQPAAQLKSAAFAGQAAQSRAIPRGGPFKPAINFAGGPLQRMAVAAVHPRPPANTQAGAPKFHPAGLVARQTHIRAVNSSVLQRMEEDNGALGNGDWYLWKDEARCDARAVSVSGCQAVKIWITVDGAVKDIIAFHNSSNSGEGNSQDSAIQIGRYIIGTYGRIAEAGQTVSVRTLALFNADADTHREGYEAQSEAQRIIRKCLNAIGEETRIQVIPCETRWVATGSNYATIELQGSYDELVGRHGADPPVRAARAVHAAPVAGSAPRSARPGSRSKGCCFLTTACTEHAGLPDDCAELTALRWFRDNYLSARADGPALVAEYYRIAPALVDRIHLAPDADRIYQGILRTVRECVARIGNGQFEATLTLYREMAASLADRFQS